MMTVSSSRVLLIQAGAGVEVPEAELRQEPGHRLVKGLGQPGVAVLDLVPVHRGLDGQALLIPLAVGHGALLGQGQGDPGGGEHLVEHADGV